MAVRMKMVAVLCVVLHLGATQDDRIFPPIKEGQEVGLVIIPGAYLKPDQYFAVTQNIQEASEFALWVYVQDEPTATVIPRQDFVVTAKEALRLAGLPQDAPFVSIGHSMGGAFMIFELEETPSLVDGLITWGADGFITAENAVLFNGPAMTLAGDLDGLTRVTMLAKQFRDLSVLPEDMRLRCPVRTLTGLNHVSFTTGDVPLVPSLLDLPAEIEGEEARRIIADATAFFIDFCARLKLGEDISADLDTLQEWLEFQTEFYAPLIAAMEMELSPDGLESPWAKEAQRIVGAAYEEEVVVLNYAVADDDLASTRSSVERFNDTVVMANTTTSLPSEAFWGSAATLASKLSSKEKFDQVLGREPSQPLPQCKDANLAVWDLIYPTISDLARSRFEARGYTLNFKDDDAQIWGPGWILSTMEFSSDGKTLNVTSTSLKTDVDFPGDMGGAHYCKLLSPFRAIEFLYIDSLRPDGF